MFLNSAPAPHCTTPDLKSIQSTHSHAEVPVLLLWGPSAKFQFQLPHTRGKLLSPFKSKFQSLRHTTRKQVAHQRLQLCIYILHVCTVVMHLPHDIILQVGILYHSKLQWMTLNGQIVERLNVYSGKHSFIVLSFLLCLKAVDTIGYQSK